MNFTVWLNSIKLLDFSTSVDVLINLSITQLIDIPGTYKYTAQSYEECYGERLIDYDLFFGEAETEDDVFTLTEEQLDEIKENYKGEIDKILWNKIRGAL